MGNVKNSRTDEVCHACEGAGVVPDDRDMNDPARMEYTCPVCDGMGTVEPESNTTLEDWQRRHAYDKRLQA